MFCVMQVWHYVETFTGHASQIVALATPHSTLQSGSNAPCYVTAAFSDGTIQCLLRDSLQQIGSVELPKTGMRRFAIQIISRE
jgi:hypothetical protein